MSDALKLVLGGVIALVGKIVWDWLARPLRSTARAGEKSSEWWEQKFATIMREVMMERNALLENMVRKVIREELATLWRRR